MILIDTPYEKIYEVMESEREKVEFALTKEFARAEKKFHQAVSLPVIHHAVYTVPSSGNRYLVWLYAGNQHEKRVKPRSGFALMVNDRDGKRNFYTTKLYDRFNSLTCKTEKISILSHYTAHFMSRYRERKRYPTSLSSLDLAATFFGRNNRNVVRSGKEMINGRHSRQDNYRSAMLQDGVSLLHFIEITAPDGKPVEVNRHNTFLTEEMLKQSQKENFVHIPEGDDIEMYKAMLKHLKGLCPDFSTAQVRPCTFDI